MNPDLEAAITHLTAWLAEHEDQNDYIVDAIDLIRAAGEQEAT